MQPPLCSFQKWQRSHVKGTVYLLHFSQPVGGHACHYIGWAQQGGLSKRLAQHESGNGSSTPLVRALIQQGGHFELARTWRHTDRFFERKLKNRRKTPQICPICRAGEE